MNFRLDDVALVPEIRKPFDVLVKGQFVQSNRGDWIRTRNRRSSHLRVRIELQFSSKVARFKFEIQIWHCPVGVGARANFVGNTLFEDVHTSNVVDKC